MQRLPPEVLTLYAELVEQLTALEARRAIGHATGTFVSKQVKGQTYYYFQHSVPGGAVRQTYVGRRTPELDSVIERFSREKVDVEAERSHVQRLCAELRAGGAAVTDTGSARVLAALADAAVFRLGGVLVGTHAFVTMGNMLGVRWAHGLLRTDDIDIAGEPTLAIAVPDLRSDVPSTLDSLGMGFLPVPGLSPREPHTSFKVRGKSLRVDLLTPLRGRPRGPVVIPRFRAAAEPLRYLDFLLEDTQRAVVIDGGGVLVEIPSPARFGLHKLIVASSRAAAFQVKSDKDLRQAGQLIALLADDRPGDLELAWEQALRRGPPWRRVLALGRKLLGRRAPDAESRLGALVGK